MGGGRDAWCPVNFKPWVKLTCYFTKMSLIFGVISIKLRKSMQKLMKIASIFKCMGLYEYLLNPSPFSGRILHLPPSSPTLFFLPFGNKFQESSSIKIHKYLCNHWTDFDKIFGRSSEFDLVSDSVTRNI